MSPDKRLIVINSRIIGNLDSSLGHLVDVEQTCNIETLLAWRPILPPFPNGLYNLNVRALTYSVAIPPSMMSSAPKTKADSGDVK